MADILPLLAFILALEGLALLGERLLGRLMWRP